MVLGARGEAMTTRLRPVIQLTLSPDVLSRLAEIASRSGTSRSAVVEWLVREAEMPRVHRSKSRIRQQMQAWEDEADVFNELVRRGWGRGVDNARRSGK
jgi:predicted transcriptional regulator